MKYYTSASYQKGRNLILKRNLTKLLADILLSHFTFLLMPDIRVPKFIPREEFHHRLQQEQDDTLIILTSDNKLPLGEGLCCCCWVVF